jgi:hypothetical protein
MSTQPKYPHAATLMTEYVAANTNTVNLPPDPDEQNDDRANWAEATLITFMGCTGTDAEDAVADLLTDLMHWCDRRGVKFNHELDRAHGQYRDETSTH